VRIASNNAARAGLGPNMITLEDCIGLWSSQSTPAPIDNAKAESFDLLCIQVLSVCADPGISYDHCVFSQAKWKVLNPNAGGALYVLRLGKHEEATSITQRF
jgi:hypothetical protein